MTVYRLKVEYDINGEGERATTKMKNVLVGSVWFVLRGAIFEVRGCHWSVHTLSF